MFYGIFLETALNGPVHALPEVGHAVLAAHLQGVELGQLVRSEGLKESL